MTASMGFFRPYRALVLALHNRWRGRGVGGALLDALCSGLAEAGVASVSLSVEVDNPSRRLYLRSGFVDHGWVGGTFTMIRGLEFDQAS